MNKRLVAVICMFAPAAVLSGGPLAAASAVERIQRGNLITENVPETPTELRARLLHYQNTRSAALGGWPADGAGLLVTTGFGETPQVHLVEAPGGARHQLTFFDEPIIDLAPSPGDANLFAFARDRGGDENYQMFIFDRSTGASTQLSDGKGRKGFVLWSPDGERLAWYATRAGAGHAIIVAPVVAGEFARDQGRVVFSGKGWWSPQAWSPDGKTILLLHYISITQSELYLLDIESGKAAQVNPSANKIFYSDAEFSRDGKFLYLTSDEGGEFLDLYRYDIASGEKTNLTTDIDWDIEAVEVSPDGGAIAYLANEAGRSALYIRNAKTNAAMPAPDLPPGVVDALTFSPDGLRLGFSFNAANAPSDVFSWRMRRRGELERWTRSEVGGLDASLFIEPEFFAYDTFDQVDGRPRRIPAFIYKPKGPGPHPVIVSIHGGPEAQARPIFSSSYQFWASEMGVAVVAPNVRGSTGFGKFYVKLDNGRKREDSVRDIGALLDWIAAQPDLDADRVIVYGSSYGGYMVLASAVNYNDRIAGAVDIVGISNFVTFLENTAAYRRDLRRPEYGDERDPAMRAFLETISPLNDADKISKPIFIVQGLNDPRVPVSEAVQILAAVRANGGEAWYMLATDEGHGFRKKPNRDALSEAVALFIEHIFDIDLMPDAQMAKCSDGSC